MKYKALCDYCGGFELNGPDHEGTLEPAKWIALNIDFAFGTATERIEYRRKLCHKCIDKIFTHVLGEPKYAVQKDREDN